MPLCVRRSVRAATCVKNAPTGGARLGEVATAQSSYGLLADRIAELAAKN
ncbi:hypothetical protein BX265_7918 [Streptomyces sp. TLI_235]|nr:hypothetical protein BX265_7918 [Streptomyces sp. TLI_235]